MKRGTRRQRMRTALALCLGLALSGCGTSGQPRDSAGDASVDAAPVEASVDTGSDVQVQDVAAEEAAPDVAMEDAAAISDAGIDQDATGVDAEAGTDAPADATSMPACDGGGCPSVKKVVAGGGSTCAIFQDDRIKCWGANVYGLLGLGDEINRGDKPNQMGNNLPFVDIGTGRTVVDLAVGGGHTCALLDRGEVKCWGGNTFCQLGIGDNLPRGLRPNQMGDNLPVVNLGTGHAVVKMTAGSYHTCAIFDDGKVKCWGDNLDNKLGVAGPSLPYSLGCKASEMGDNLPFVDLGAGRTALALAVGVGHTCALLDTHQIKCWGSNNWGNLGAGDAGGTSVVDLGTGRSAVAVSAGHGHTCALLDNGQVKCWGRNEFGELGLGDLVDRGARSSEMGDNLPAVDLGTGRTAREVHTGDSHSCAVLDNDAVKCWGLNDGGQLGVGNTTRYGSKPGQMGDNLPAADLGATGALRVFSTHTGHNCALFQGGRLVCWGLNSQGRLGLGDTANRGDSPDEIGLGMPLVDVGVGA